MSSLFSDINKQTLQKTIIPPILPEVTLVRLNNVLQTVLQKYQQQINKGNIVIRCETLPVIEGDEQQLCKLFENIFSILFDSASDVRYFLNIDCSQEDHEIMNLSVSNHKIFHI